MAIDKIFDLTQVGSDTDSSQVATDNDNNVQGYLMFGFGLIYIFTIYGFILRTLFTLQPAHGAQVDNLITWVLYFL
jgi:cytochrome c oxidase subunit 2